MVYRSSPGNELKTLFYLFPFSRVHQSLGTWRTLHADMKDFEDWLGGAELALKEIQAEGLNRAERKEKLKELESQVTARHKYLAHLILFKKILRMYFLTNYRVMSTITSTCREVGTECSTADAVFLREKQDVLGKRWRALLSGLASVRQRYLLLLKEKMGRLIN